MMIEILSFLFPVVNMYEDQNVQFVLHTHSELAHRFIYLQQHIAMSQQDRGIQSYAQGW